MRTPLLVLLVALSGCTMPAPDEVPGNGSSPLCREGEGAFIKAQHHPGFITPDYQFMFYTLEREGTLTYFRANETDGPGTGELRPKSGVLHEVTVAQVKAEMQDHGVYRTDRDYLVSMAWRDETDADKFDSFCGVVLDDFYNYKARYEQNNIADCDGFTFKATTTKGTHTSYSYCQAGPQDVRDSFDEMVDDARDRFGIEGI